jgi:hypothetical protein
MTIRDRNAPVEAEAVERPSRYPLILDIFARLLSVAMMLLGLRQWAIILGVMASAGGPFEQMTVGWQVMTMHFAVVDLVAAVGLWMRVAWGDVVWLYAALSEIVIHTVFAETFGIDAGLIAFHSLTIIAGVTLTVLARRAAPH